MRRLASRAMRGGYGCRLNRGMAVWIGDVKVSCFLCRTTVLKAPDLGLQRNPNTCLLGGGLSMDRAPSWDGYVWLSDGALKPSARMWSVC